MAVVGRRKPRDASELTHLYTEQDSGGPYTIHFDQWFTRRKRFHCITDKRGATVFRSRWVSDLIDWLDANEVHRYTALGGKRPWLVTMATPRTKKEPKK
jgi:hypothetical protein